MVENYDIFPAWVMTKKYPDVWRIACPCCGYCQDYSWYHRGEFFICPECHEYLGLIPILLERTVGIAYRLIEACALAIGGWKIVLSDFHNGIKY